MEAFFQGKSTNIIYHLCVINLRDRLVQTNFKEKRRFLTSVRSTVSVFGTQEWSHRKQWI